MTGIRHEQAVLVVMAYIVGFVTAFIAFGVNQVNDVEEIVAVTAPAVVPAQTKAPANPPSAATGNNNTASLSAANYENGIFSTSKDGEEVVLSVDSSMMPELENDPQFATQGLHNSPPVFVVAPAGDYVYFCEEYTSTGTCRSFVYDLNEEIIRPVHFDGERTEVALAEATAATWTEAEGLKIANYTVVDTNGTWDMSIQ